jgi:hypothetical protein
MIILGIAAILIGYIFKFPHHLIVADVGWVLLIIGVILLVLGYAGHPLGGRRHYW